MHVRFTVFIAALILFAGCRHGTQVDEAGSPAIPEGASYLQSIRANIVRSYDWPDTIGEQERTNLKALVAFRIDRNGALLGEPLVVKSSGNEPFDSAVVNAIKRAAPFGAPPEQLRHTLEAEGFIAEFRP